MKRNRKNKIVVVAIVLFWVAATGWLILNEIAPGSFSRVSQGYRSMFSGGIVVADSWMQISLNGQKIGYSHTSIESDEDNAIQKYKVYNNTELNISIMNQEQSVSVTAESSLDVMYHLQDFSFSMRSGDYRMRIIGHREEGDLFEVKVKTGDSYSTVHINIPDDAIVYSPMVELALRSIKPGRQKRIKTFNPLSMTTENIIIKALRYEDITSMEKVYHATVLSANYQGLEIMTWIDSDGKVLRQETPFGWTLEACDAETALGTSSGNTGEYDLLAGLAVSVDGVIDMPRDIKQINITMKGLSLDTDALVSHRQKVVEVRSNSVDMVLLKETLPANTVLLGNAPDEVTQYLESSIYIQSDDGDIIKKAKNIIGNETNSLKAALVICDWVNEKMDKIPAVSVPSARDILKVMSGDCNEHTYLFTALARSIGIPTKVTVGIVYNEGIFYYHAWPAVYVGRWVEMDPTFGQHAVDATHIKLLEGELQEQMKLMGVIGRISIQLNDER